MSVCIFHRFSKERTGVKQTLNLEPSTPIKLQKYAWHVLNCDYTFTYLKATIFDEYLIQREPFPELWWHRACRWTRNPLHTVLFQDAFHHTLQQTPYHKVHHSSQAHPSGTRGSYTSLIFSFSPIQCCWVKEDCQIPQPLVYHLPPSNYLASTADVRAASHWMCHTRLRLWGGWSRLCGPSVCETW